MRLAKFLAHGGVASRRAAEEIIRAGRVTVDGEKVVDPARGVDESNEVIVDSSIVQLVTQHQVWAIHKPKGVVSTAADTHGRPTVVEMVDPGESRRLYPVGRLDADTTGLILLTDDGDLADRLTHPRNEVPKVYLAEVANAPVRDPALRKLREGVRLEDGRTSPAKVRKIRGAVLEITIHEGRKRQVRRMCDAVGHPVTKLQRISFGPLQLGDMREGHVRKLTPAEVERLRKA